VQIKKPIEQPIKVDAPAPSYIEAFRCSPQLKVQAQKSPQQEIPIQEAIPTIAILPQQESLVQKVAPMLAIL
jgi:hypothetical protein